MNNPEFQHEGGRVPPQAVEVEENVLGSMLMEPESIDIVRPILQADDWYKPANKHIYQAIIHLHEHDKSTDLVAVENYLRDHSLLDVVGGSGYLADLSKSLSSSANVDYHATIIYQKSMKRKMILMGNEIIKTCYDTASDPEDALQSAIKMIDQITDQTYTNHGQFVEDLMQGVIEDILERRNKEGLTGIGTGLAIDKYTGGWQDGNYYILAARPSIGKTAFILTGAFNAALFESIQAIGYYSNIEMKNAALIERRLAFEAEVNSIKMRDGKVSDKEMAQIYKAVDRLNKGRLILDDTPSPNINEWRAKYKTAVRKHGVQFGVVDYLQLMSGNKEGTREQEISSISRGLKATAKETNTPIIALSQLSRECEKRTGSEPYLSDLRESGSLEQDADGVILLNRPEFFNHGTYKNKPTAGKGWVKVAKMRNGMTGEFSMNFDAKYAMWRNEYRDDQTMNQTNSAPTPHSLPDDMDDGPGF